MSKIKVRACRRKCTASWVAKAEDEEGMRWCPNCGDVANELSPVQELEAEEHLRKNVVFLRSFAQKVKALVQRALSASQVQNGILGLLKMYENRWPNWLDEGIELDETTLRNSQIDVLAHKLADASEAISMGCHVTNPPKCSVCEGASKDGVLVAAPPPPPGQPNANGDVFPNGLQIPQRTVVRRGDGVVARVADCGDNKVVVRFMCGEEGGEDAGSDMNRVISEQNGKSSTDTKNQGRSGGMILTVDIGKRCWGSVDLVDVKKDDKSSYPASPSDIEWFTKEWNDIGQDLLWCWDEHPGHGRWTIRGYMEWWYVESHGHGFYNEGFVIEGIKPAKGVRKC